jgi:hypothetical protein
MRSKGNRHRCLTVSSTCKLPVQEKYRATEIQRPHLTNDARQQSRMRRHRQTRTHTQARPLRSLHLPLRVAEARFVLCIQDAASLQARKHSSATLEAQRLCGESMGVSVDEFEIARKWVCGSSCLTLPRRVSDMGDDNGERRRSEVRSRRREHLRIRLISFCVSCATLLLSARGQAISTRLR